MIRLIDVWTHRLLPAILVFCLFAYLPAPAETDEAFAALEAAESAEIPAEGAELSESAEDAAETEEADIPAPDGEVPYEGLEVYFLDLGRVDGILIRCGGENSFIDVGMREDVKPTLRFLKAMGITHLHSYIGTHAHYDHIEGGPDLIAAFHPDVIYVPHERAISTLMECASAEQQVIIANTRQVMLRPGDGFTIGDARVTTLGPLKVRKADTSGTAENDNSLILRLDYGERSFLFTGDTSDKVLRDVNAAYPGLLDVDVLKNPHHNGAHREDVLDMITPEITVFCTENDSQPTKAYQSQLAQRGSAVYITGSANQGHVAVVTDGRRMEVRCGYSIKGITLAPVPRMVVGQEYQLNGAIEPKDALAPDRQLGWKSSDESVALVYNGRIRVMGQGTATITATAINGVSASVDVECWQAFVELDRSNMRLSIGQTEKLTAKITPSNPSGVKGEWICEDERVATVSGGKVTGVGDGTTRVIARLSNGFEAVCEVTVQGFLAKKVRINRHKATMKVGDTLTLAATVQPEGYNLDDLQWYCSDESILWVDQSGNITAVGTGKARVAAVAAKGVYDICTIRVK